MFALRSVSGEKEQDPLNGQAVDDGSGDEDEEDTVAAGAIGWFSQIHVICWSGFKF